MTNTTASGQGIRRSVQVGYALSWNKQLNFNMGWYSWYLTGRQYYSAFAKLYDAIRQVKSDRKQRVFIVNKKTNEVSKERQTEFENLVGEFKKLFGISNSNNGKISLLELRALEKPDPKEDKVYISRKVPFELAWGKSSSPYIALKIGYAYQVVETQFGFSKTKIIPMIRRDDGSSSRQRTNCISYVLWQEQTRKALELLLPVATDIETIIASYLHHEGEPKYVPQAVEGISMDYDNEGEFAPEELEDFEQ